MATDRMKRLRLIAIKKERDALLKELMLLGCVQITETTDASGVLKRESAELDVCRAEYDKLLKAIEIEDGFAPPLLGVFSRKQKVSKQVLFNDAVLREGIARAGDIVVSGERIRQIEVEEQRIREALERLRPWVPLELPLELSDTENCLVIKGLLPPSSDFVSLATEIRVRVPESQMVKSSSDRSGTYAVLIAMKNNCAKVLETADRYSFTPVYFEGVTGTAAANSNVLRQELAELDSEKKRLVADIKGDAASRGELKLCADRQQVRIDLAESAERLLYTHMTMLLEGWFPAGEEKSLVELFRRFTCAWEISESGAGESAPVPRSFVKAGRETGSLFAPLACRPGFVGIIDERDT